MKKTEIHIQKQAQPEQNIQLQTLASITMMRMQRMMRML